MPKFSASDFLHEKQPKGLQPFARFPEVVKACKDVISALETSSKLIPCSSAALHEEMTRKCGYKGSLSTFRRHLKALNSVAYERYWGRER